MRANPSVPLRGAHNECPGCGQLFNSMRAFEKHRTGNHAGNQRRCLSMAEMRAAGMMLRGVWWVSEPRGSE